MTLQSQMAELFARLNADMRIEAVQSVVFSPGGSVSVFHRYGAKPFANIGDLLAWLEPEVTTERTESTEPNGS